MPIPPILAHGLRAPVITAPMFLTSGPDLVVACCSRGVIGTFPALNPRSTADLGDWLDRIADRLAAHHGTAVHGVNLIVHRSNPRLAADLEMVVRHRVPLVITSLGAVPDVVSAVQSYGGVVLHDVIRTRHAEKAAAAGVDGIVAIAAGAGGHGGTISPFALLAEIRSVFGGLLALGGAITTGRDVAAARMMGADLAYIGSRFIATREATVSMDQKRMMLDARAEDIVHTSRISGVPANFLRPSIVAVGLDPDALPQHGALELQSEARAWKSFWSAGHGVGAIRDIPAAGDLADRLVAEYRAAMAAAAGDPFLTG